MTIDTLVLTKGVPDFREGQVSFDEDGHLERGKTPTVMNPNDKHALRAALQTKVRNGGSVSLMSMGPPSYAEILEEGMADVCADELYLLSDREMGAADTWATAMTIATGIQHLEAPPDLIFAGFKTADGETGHTGPQAEWCLGIHDDLPAFVVADPEFEPTYRRADHRLRHKDFREQTRARAAEFGEYLAEDSEEDPTDWEDFHMWDHEYLNLDPDFIGLDGSPTIVAGVDPIPKAPSEREATVVGPDDEDGMEEIYEEMAAYAGGG